MNKKRTETRILKSFHLRPGEDDDLIEWFNTMAKGTRTETIRAALRAYKGRSQSDPVIRLEQTVSRMFSDLQGVIRQELAKVTVVGGGATTTATTAVPTLTNDQLAARSKKIGKSGW